MRRRHGASFRAAFVPAALAVSLVLALGALSTAANAEPRADLDARARDVLSDPALQRELPATEAHEKDEDRPEETSRPRPRSLPPFETPSVLSGPAQLVLWCALGVALALVVAAVVRSARRPGGDVPAPPGGSLPEKRRPAVVASLEKAEALATAGRFADAIRALLGAAFRDVERQREVRVEESMTAREVAREAELEAEPRSALLELVAAVEVSHFGGISVDRTDYERCVASYVRLTEMLA